jgi:hypothetical protein
MDEIKSSPGDTLGNPKQPKPAYDNSTASQRARILKHFETCPRLSTMEAREHHGIMHPGGRVLELRQKGHVIDTHWVAEPDSNGVMHRVGLYVYQGRAGGLPHER